MYSQTKSFVGIAIGLLEEDGLLRLDDAICTYFPDKVERYLPPYLRELTIRQMLMMRTAGATPSWFTHTDPDRTHLYFEENGDIKPIVMTE
jgi:CubicO group peptidase (beta-lactamase class C family)